MREGASRATSAATSSSISSRMSFASTVPPSGRRYLLVRFPGGSLDIDWRKDDGGHVFMTGGVERSFEGVLDAEWLRERGAPA